VTLKMPRREHWKLYRLCLSVTSTCSRPLQHLYKHAKYSVINSLECSPKLSLKWFKHVPILDN